MLRTSESLTPQARLERNLEELETARRKGAQVVWRMNREDGTVDVRVAMKKSLTLWLKNKFGFKHEKQLLAQQCLDILQNPVSKKSIRDRVVRDVGQDVLPFVNPAAFKAAVNQPPALADEITKARKTLDECGRHLTDSGYDEEKAANFLKAREKLLMLVPERLSGVHHQAGAYEVITNYFSYHVEVDKQERKAAELALVELRNALPPQALDYLLRQGIANVNSTGGEHLAKGLGLDRTRAGDISHKSLAEQQLIVEGIAQLRAELQALRAKNPNIGIADTWQFMEAYCSLSLLEPSVIDKDAKDMTRTLNRQFDETRQKGLYNQTFQRQSIQAAHNILSTLPGSEGQRVLLQAYNGNDNSPEHFVMDTALQGIKSKIRNPLSITGDLDTLVTRSDLELLQTFATGIWRSEASHSKNQLRQEVQKLSQNPEYRALRKYLLTLDVSKLKAQLHRLDHDQSLNPQQKAKLHKQLQPHLEKLARANKLLLDIQQGPGRRWHASVLSDPALAGKNFSRVFSKLEDIRVVHSPSLDLAQLQWMKQQNHNAPRHPSVVIEGAGPVGLLTAINLYIKGGNVSVLERRGTDYSREQILRLDSQWINELRFVLGDKFNDLFHPTDGIGHLSSDGSGSIVTRELEKTLHSRFSELVSLEEGSATPEGNVHLHRSAAFSVKDVLPPESPGGRYRVLGDYEEKYDRQQSRPGEVKDPATITPQLQQQTIEADILVCAGGKNSPTRDKFFRRGPVTDSAEYGVASWKGESLKTDKLDTFPAIQGVIQLDTRFQQRFTDRVRTEMQVQEVYSEAGEAVVKEMLETSPGTPFTDMMEALNDQVVQVRTFENRGIAYVGMEIPAAAKNWFSQLNNAAKQAGLSENEIKELNRAAKESWFQTVAEVQGFAEKLNASMDNISHQFTATFAVAQEVLSRHSTELVPSGNGQNLTVVAIGDAATSPHFMSASGATGGRESKDVLVAYLESMINEPEQAARHRQQMDERFEENKKYVLSRGQAFLRTSARFDSNQVLVEQARAEMAQLVNSSAEPGWPKPYTVEKTVSSDRFLVTMGASKFYVDVKDKGELQVHDQRWNNLGLRATFKEVELQDLLATG